MMSFRLFCFYSLLLLVFVGFFFFIARFSRTCGVVLVSAGVIQFRAATICNPSSVALLDLEHSNVSSYFRRKSTSRRIDLTLIKLTLIEGWALGAIARALSLSLS